MPIHMGGIQSGMDTEALIGVILNAEKMPITHLESKIVDLEDDIFAWNAVDSALADLSSFTQDLSSYSTWNQKTSTTSDEATTTATAISTAVAADYDINITTLADAHSVHADSIETTSLGINDSTTAVGASGTFTINGEEISYDAEDSLQDIAMAINVASASMSSSSNENPFVAKIIDKTLILESGVQGVNNVLSIEETAGTLLQDLNILSDPTTINVSNESAGVDLAGTIDGIAITASSNKGVDSLIQGVSLNFKDTGNSTITIGNNTDNIKTKLTDFIGKYNDTLELVKNLGKVQLGSTGDVSTTGLLQGDFLITDIQTKMQNIITQSNPGFFGSEFSSLNDIGIFTSGLDSKLTMIDENKLDDALANNFDDVANLFKSVEYDSDGVVKNQGIMKGLNSYIDRLISPLTGSISNKTQDISNQVNNKQNLINRKTSDLVNYESYLWEHFGAMESAMASIQNGGAYLMQSLGM